MMVSFRNDVGLVKQVKVGVSWTAFFFGALPFFFRGMWGLGLAWFIAGGMTLGASNLVLMFFMNKQMAHYYLERGYRPVGQGWDAASIAWDVAVQGGE